MTRKNSIIVFVILSIILAACGGSANSADSKSITDTGVMAEFEEAAMEMPAGAPAPAVDMSMVESYESAGNDIVVEQVTQSFPQERLIIRNADLSLVVTDTDAAIATITEMAESNGGWVVNSNVYQYNEDAKTGSITVRVPSSGFTSALDAMKALAVEVISESTSGQDVTDEYVDLSLQLDNLEATADRVRNFLDETRNVEEALSVNQELSRLEGEIERIKGRIQFLSQSATYSTITVNLTPDVLSQPIEVGGWQPKGIAREAIQALLSALQGTVSFVIWLGIYVLPLGLLYGIPIWLVIRFVIRWRRRRRTGTAVSETAQS